MLTNAIISFIALLIFSLSGLGWAYTGTRIRDRGLGDRTRYSICNWDIGLGFSISYVFYCIFYFLAVLIDQKKSLEFIYYFCIFWVSIGFFIFLYNAGRGFRSLSKEVFAFSVFNRIAVAFVAVLTVVFIPQLILGSKPFLASDSWSHISIINRMLDSRLLVLNSFSLPGDNYLLHYSPHHSLLSVIAFFCNADSLDTFIGARYFYPLILISALLAFLEKLDETYTRNALHISLAIVFLALMFPTSDGLWRGSADYRMPAFILMFVTLRIIYPILTGQLEISASRVLAIIGLSLAIAVTHAIEISTLTLMIVPFGFLISFLQKSRKRFFFSIGILAIFAISGGVALLLIDGTYAPLNKSMDYLDFVHYYISQLNYHIVIYTWLVSLGVLILYKYIAIKFNSIVVLFFIVSFFSSLIFGPLNPLLFPLYNNLMGSSHSNRLMYAFPFYLVLSYFGIGVINSISTSIGGSRRIFLLGCCCVIFSAVAFNFYKKSGLDGNFSYKGSDRLSQLNLYPNFYRIIEQKYHRQIVISDTFTSAPINAISNNYIFTHRPWTGGTNDRFGVAKEIMTNPLDANSILKICEYKIDLLAINTNRFPEGYRSVFSQQTWLFSDFRLKINPAELKARKGFDYVDSVDGIDIVKIQREFLCASKDVMTQQNLLRSGG